MSTLQISVEVAKDNRVKSSTLTFSSSAEHSLPSLGIHVIADLIREVEKKIEKAKEEKFEDKTE